MTSRVFVLGSINADTSLRVTALPRPGETVLASSSIASSGGKGANQAIAASAAGAATSMVGAVGDDTSATVLLDDLRDRGVGTEGIATRRGVDTGRAIVYVDDAAENSIVVLPGANALLDEESATAGLVSMASGDLLVLQNEIPSAVNRAAARLARLVGATVIWNAAPAPASIVDLVPDVDLLVVNEHELVQLAHVLGLPAVDDDLPALLSATARRLDADAICTLGSSGSLYIAGDRSGLIAAPEVTAVDTTSAGDTVVGYLAAHSHLPMEERIRLANTAGALTVTRAGASSSIPQLGDVETLLAGSTERTPS